MSVRTGGLIPKSVARSHGSPKNRDHMWNYICIEEPYDRTNTAGAVHDLQMFQRIRNVFLVSHSLIQDNNCDYEFITPLPPPILNSLSSCEFHLLK